MSEDHAHEFKFDPAVLERMRKLNQEYSEIENRLIGRDQSKDQIKMAAISVLQKNEQNTLEIVGTQLSDAGCGEIAKALTGNVSVTALTLREVGMGKQGAVAIADAVKKGHRVRELYLDDNDLSSAEAVAAVANLLTGNTTLRVLSLDSNKIEDIAVLCAALAKNTALEVLQLSDNIFGDKGVSELITVLATSNKTLRRLVLNNSEITNTGATKLAEFMASHSCMLREVEFQDNLHVTAEGLKQVQNTLRNSNFEETAALSFKQKVRPVPATPPLKHVGNKAVPPPPQSSSRSLLWVGLLLVAGGVAGGIYLYTRKKPASKE